MHCLERSCSQCLLQKQSQKAHAIMCLSVCSDTGNGPMVAQRVQQGGHHVLYQPATLIAQGPLMLFGVQKHAHRYLNKARSAAAIHACASARVLCMQPARPPPKEAPPVSCTMHGTNAWDQSCSIDGTCFLNRSYSEHKLAGPICSAGCLLSSMFQGSLPSEAQWQQLATTKNKFWRIRPWGTQRFVRNKSTCPLTATARPWQCGFCQQGV